MADGTHFIADFLDCRCGRDTLYDGANMAALVPEIVRAAGLTVVREAFYQFPDPEGGYTMAVVIAESHVMLHTWPDQGKVNACVYVCNRSRDNRLQARSILEKLKDIYNPAQPEITEIERR